MRACFFRSAHAIYQPDVDLPYQVGLSQSSRTSINAHLSNFYLTGNKGNMVHRMAAVQSLDVNRALSSQVHLPKLLNKLGADKFKQYIAKNFDAVIITMSNALRKGPSDGLLRPVLESLPDIPLYVLGLGMQTRLESINDLDEDMLEVVKLLEEKATLLGVRGHDTKRWLKENGISKAEAIGCPSMFVYPLNIARLSTPNTPSKFMTSGYLGKNFLDHRDDRMGVLLRAFQGYDCSYVFQMDLNKFADISDIIDVYDEATNELDPEVMKSAIYKETGLEAPFNKYFSFNDVSAWRQAASHHDAFIGDRIHGSVAAMQAGTPAIVLFADARVRELTSYHGVPACSIKEFGEIGVDEAVSKYLNADELVRFKKRYRDTLVKYKDKIEASGLKLVHKPEIDLALKNLSSL